jgi:hypothetical protein
MDIHHKNYIRDDNHIDNLDCMSHAENMKDASDRKLKRGKYFKNISK